MSSTRLAMFAAMGAAMLTVAAPRLARAEPVPEDQRIPVDVRRTTLIVRDIERSLSFWRDALGLEVVYDEVIERPIDPEQPEGEQRSLRLVLMRANDSFVGGVGLLEYTHPRRPDPGMGEDRPIIGDFIMVVNATDLDTRFARVRAVPGVKVLSAPSRVEYPAPGGEGVIPVMVSMVRDPDGYFVELNQILGAPAGSRR